MYNNVTGGGKALAGRHGSSPSHVNHRGRWREKDQHGAPVHCGKPHHQRSCRNSLGNSQEYHVSIFICDSQCHGHIFILVT